MCNGSYCFKRGAAKSCPPGYATSASSCGDYGDSLDSSLSNGKAGDSLCYKCFFNCQFSSQDGCEAANTGFSCSQNASTGCFVTNGCKTGYHQTLGECRINTCQHSTDGSELVPVLAVLGDKNIGKKTGRCSALSQNTALYNYSNYRVTGPDGTLYCCEVTAVTCNQGYYQTEPLCKAACSGSSKICESNGNPTCAYTCETCANGTYSNCEDLPSGQECVETSLGNQIPLGTICPYQYKCPEGYYTDSSLCNAANGCASGVCETVADHGVCAHKCVDAPIVAEICPKSYTGTAMYGPTTDLTRCNQNCGRSCQFLGTSSLGNSCYICCTNSFGTTSCALK
ncbi:hypothetical protein IJ556_05325 [bacterium]|nr:hypothetical protein [bacterium]